MKYPYVLPVLAVRDAGSGTVQTNSGQHWSDPVAEIASLRTALSQEREAREKAEADRDHVIRTSDAYNATEREARAIMDEAAAIERAETLEASLAEAKRLLKPFADTKGHFDGHVRDDDTVEIALRNIRARHVRDAARFLSQEPHHER